MKQKVWKVIKPLVRTEGAAMVVIMFYLLRIFPIKKNKVVVSVSAGRRYDDNQKFIIEELHKLRPDADIVWVKDPRYAYEVPEWLRTVRWRTLRWMYEYVTAKVWLDNCVVPDYFVKRKGQLYIETWHGGLGIKNTLTDVIGRSAAVAANTHFLKNASDMADVFISNSDHLSTMYRRAFNYHGPIWKCGYPKIDMLVQNNPEDGEQARRELGIPLNHKLLLYAPTWRLRFTEEQHIDMEVYNLDMKRLKKALTERFGGEWTMAIRFHTLERLYSKGYQKKHPDVMDVTDYQDMQRLVMAADVMVSDYSTCIFDGQMREIPCFIYATDYDQYRLEERGVYYEMEELPFPYAKNNDEMEQNIKTYVQDVYLKKWGAFKERMKLHETGHAARDIAEKMIDFMDGKTVEWPNDYPALQADKI